MIAENPPNVTELNAVAQFESNIEVSRQRIGAAVYDQMMANTKTFDVTSFGVPVE